MLSRNSIFIFFRRYKYDYKISFFVEIYFYRKHFHKHYIRFTHLLITRFLTFDIMLIYFN